MLQNVQMEWVSMAVALTRAREFCNWFWNVNPIFAHSLFHSLFARIYAKLDYEILFTANSIYLQSEKNT